MDDQNQQTQQTQGQVKLADLDFFSLVKLDHLSPEEKVQKLAEIQEVVFTDFVQQDLPNILSPEDLEEYKKLVQDNSQDADKIENFLRSKVSNFEEIIMEKMLAAKKALVRQNMLTRLDIVKQALQDPAVEADSEKRSKFEADRGKLNQIIFYIDEDDWATASQFIASL